MSSYAKVENATAELKPTTIQITFDDGSLVFWDEHSEMRVF